LGYQQLPSSYWAHWAPALRVFLPYGRAQEKSSLYLSVEFVSAIAGVQILKATKMIE
jgi:hypothetical protein